MPNPKITITPFAMVKDQGPGLDLLEQAGFEIHLLLDQPLATGNVPESHTIEALRGTSALIASGEYLTANVLKALPDLRVIARFGVGYDRIDIDAATACHIPIAITANSTHHAVAEHTMSLLYAAGRNIFTNDRQTRAGMWPRDLLPSLREHTLGIVGLGRAGRCLALQALAIGMKVIANDQYPDEKFATQHDISFVNLETLLQQSDYVSLHCPLTNATKGLIDREELSKMKPGSVLVNASRGGVVVEQALFDALQSGHLRAAGLDVFESEPASTDNPLFQLDNVVVTSHLAGVDRVSNRNMALECVDNILKLWQGEWPSGSIVNANLQKGWHWK